MRKHLKRIHGHLKKPWETKHYVWFSVICSILFATIYTAVSQVEASLSDQWYTTSHSIILKQPAFGWWPVISDQFFLSATGVNFEKFVLFVSAGNTIGTITANTTWWTWMWYLSGAWVSYTNYVTSNTLTPTSSAETVQVFQRLGNPTPVQAVARPWYVFVQWSDGSTTNPRVATLANAWQKIYARFAPATQVRFISAGNGTWSYGTWMWYISWLSYNNVYTPPMAWFPTPPTLWCQNNILMPITISAWCTYITQLLNGWYNGSPVQAVAKPGYIFTGWYTTGNVFISMNNPYTPTLANAWQTLVARFQ